jgi:predicted nucleic acid-binding protein
MIIDTDVLIWYMKGNEKACEVIDSSNTFFISVVTYMVLGWNAHILYISEEISAKAMFYVEQHYLSHSIQLADAFIGATAIAYGYPLLTANDKHYKVLKDVQIERFRP